jgi:hypothetical protein
MHTLAVITKFCQLVGSHIVFTTVCENFGKILGQSSKLATSAREERRPRQAVLLYTFGTANRALGRFIAAATTTYGRTCGELGKVDGDERVGVQRSRRLGENFGKLLGRSRKEWQGETSGAGEVRILIVTEHNPGSYV